MKYLLLFTFIFVLISNKMLAQKPDIVVSTGHTSMISSISVSNDGQFIASGSVDKTIKIIHTASGKEMRTIAGNSQRISDVKFNDNADYVAAHVEGESLKIFDVTSGELVSKFPSSLSDFDFCLDGNFVVYLNENGELTVANYLTGKITLATGLHGVSNLVIGNKNRNTVFVYEMGTKLKEVDLRSGAVLQETSVFSEFKYVTCRMAMDPSNQFLALAVDGKTNGEDGEIYVFDRKTLKEKGVLKGHKGRIMDMCCSLQSGRLITTASDGYTKIWNLSTLKLDNSFFFRYSSSFALSPHPLENYFLLADYNTVNYLNEVTGEIAKTFKAMGNSILNLAYDQVGNYLVSSGTNVSLKIWDLEQNKISRSIQGFWPIAFSPNGKELVSMYSGIALAVWDPTTGRQMTTLNTEGELIQNISYNKEGTMLAGAGFMGVVKLWDMKTHQLIKKFTGHSGGVYSTSFSPDGKFLASCGMDYTIRIWEIESGKEIKSIAAHDIIVSDVKFSPDGKYLASSSWDKSVKIWNTKDWSLKHTLLGHKNMITTIDFSADGRYLASGAGNNAVAEMDNSVIVWDVEAGTQKCRYEGHRGMVQKVIFDKLSNYIFSTGDDGTVKVWDYSTCTEIATMASIGDNDYVIATPDNYYMSSKDALEAVSFRIGKKMYPFEQFDLKLNRPDIISARLGKTPQGLVNAYHYIYQKRLRKMGFTEAQLGDEFHLPEVVILDRNKTLTTDKSLYKFQVNAKDDKYKLDRINVYVNNVPIYGLEGLSVKNEKLQSITKELEVELTSGVNKIQVSVYNEKGVESLRETFKILYNGEVKKGDLYIISIGVSEYQNSAFNLKYAAKDAKDVMSTITLNSAHLYNSIKQRLLTNEEVTFGNVTALKGFLSQANEEDVVIIFVAGHGLLDVQMDYFFAAYNVDFNDPRKGGVSYELLEKLLSDTKAYQKLLIMDTCHSGELDKQEVETGNSENETQGDVEFRAVGVNVVEKEGFGVKKTNELMNEMFSDVRKGTGATVISSAGGAEFAMESAKWQNGLFTYCLLNGLTTNAADLNKDKEIRISELRTYVYNQVTLLSNGRQQPTARSENLIVDYRIW